MMFDIITGNACSLGAMITDSISGTCKTKKNMLLVQCISQIFYIISAIILKGYSAIAQNAVAIFRNVFAAYNKSNKIIEAVLIISPVILGLVYNNRGIIGVLPVVANLEYSVSVFAFKDNPIKLKYAFIANGIMFSIFNFAILNFVGGISCIIIVVTTITSLLKERKNKQTNKI